MVKIGERTGFKETYSLDVAFDLFINAKAAEGVRERTKTDYTNHWRYFKEFLTDKHRDVQTINELSINIIREYINWMQFDKIQYAENTDRKQHAKGLSPMTINIRLRTLKAMCRFWHEEHMLPNDIGHNVKLLRYDDNKKRTFHDDEIVRLLGTFNVRLYNDWRDTVLIRFLCSCGCRINEASNLTPDDVMFERKSAFLNPTVVKSRHGREVPLDDSVLRDLHNLIEENKRYFGNPKFVFLTTTGKQYKPNAFRHRLSVAAEKAGIERATPNMFRHYFITQYAKSGDLFSLQKIVDHKNISTTRRYVNDSQEEIAQQHAKFSPLKRIEKLENKRRLEK